MAVGKQMERTEKFFQLATRVLAENGANVVNVVSPQASRARDCRFHADQCGEQRE